MAARLLLLAFLTGILLPGCRGDGPTEPAEGFAVAAAEVDDSPTGSPGFHFLPPLSPEPRTTGVLDTSLERFVSVDVCAWNGQTCVGPSLVTFGADGGSGSSRLRVDEEAGHYSVNWHLRRFDLKSGMTYAIRVLVAGTELGHTTVAIVDPSDGRVGSHGAVPVGKTVTIPVRFRIDEGAVHVIGPDGGHLTAADGGVRLRVPPGAVSEPVGITVLQVPAPLSDPGLVAGSAYALGPDTVAFSEPAILSLGYDPSRIPEGIEESSLRVHRTLDGAWIESFHGGVDEASDVVRGTIHGLGTFGALRKRAVAVVTLTPESLVLPLPEQATLTATPRDRLHHPLNRPVQWVSSARKTATVDPGGRVSAHASGVSRITATAESKSGAARVVVVNPAFPREPMGFTQITSRPFDAVEELGWRTSLEIARHFDIVPDPSAPFSPPNVGRAGFPKDSIGGREFGTISLIRFEDSPYGQLFVSFWVRFSENWQGHRSTVNKILYISADGHLSSPVFLLAQGADKNPLNPQIWLQNTPIGARNLMNNVAPDVKIVRGRWHRWDVLLIMNTGGNADGEAHWWLDGTKLGEHRDIIYAHEWEGHAWDQVKWGPVWGGVGDVVEEDMYQMLDHVYVSGGR